MSICQNVKSRNCIYDYMNIEPSVKYHTKCSTKLDQLRRQACFHVNSLNIIKTVILALAQDIVHGVYNDV